MPLPNTSERGAVRPLPPLPMSVSEAFSATFTVIKLPPHKSPEWSSLLSGPEAKSSSEISNLTL